MSRLLFEKTGNAVWISHLDLMRLFQRAFKRAGLPLTHTQGFNPRPSVSIALPLSVGVASCCELLDFEVEYENQPLDTMKDMLNDVLIEGVHVREIYSGGRKLRDLALLSCELLLEYNQAPDQPAVSQIEALFHRDTLEVEKKGKNGITQQDLIPMIRQLQVQTRNNAILIQADICCQNPSLNPMQIVSAVTRYLPQYQPEHTLCQRKEIFDADMKIFR